MVSIQGQTSTVNTELLEALDEMVTKAQEVAQQAEELEVLARGSRIEEEDIQDLFMMMGIEDRPLDLRFTNFIK